MLHGHFTWRFIECRSNISLYTFDLVTLGQLYFMSPHILNRIFDVISTHSSTSPRRRVYQRDFSIRSSTLLNPEVKAHHRLPTYESPVLLGTNLSAYIGMHSCARSLTYQSRASAASIRQYRRHPQLSSLPQYVYIYTCVYMYTHTHTTHRHAQVYLAQVLIRRRINDSKINTGPSSREY